MAEEETAYRYLIPLEEEDGVEKPIYDTSPEGDVLFHRYNPTSLEVVQTESTPHFHKDSVNVQVEEVDANDYRDEPEDSEAESDESEAESDETEGE